MSKKNHTYQKKKKKQQQQKLSHLGCRKKKLKQIKKKKKKGNQTKPMCTCAWAFLSIKKKCTWVFLSIKKKCIPPSFLPILEKKHSSSTIYFPSSPANQTHSKKVFIHIFSPNFSIHLISPPNKHTLLRFLALLNFIRRKIILK